MNTHELEFWDEAISEEFFLSPGNPMFYSATLTEQTCFALPDNAPSYIVIISTSDGIKTCRCKGGEKLTFESETYPFFVGLKCYPCEFVNVKGDQD